MAIGLNRQGAAMLLLQAWLISYLFGIGCVIVAGNFGPYFLIDAPPLCGVSHLWGMAQASPAISACSASAGMIVLPPTRTARRRPAEM